MFLYRIAKDKGATKISDGFHPSIYHNIKNFYHNHSHHSGKEDSIVNPFICDYPINLSHEQTILDHYIKDYENKYSSLRRIMQDQRQIINNELNAFLKARSNSETEIKLSLIITKIFIFLKKINRALGEFEYCKHLLYHCEKSFGEDESHNTIKSLISDINVIKDYLEIVKSDICYKNSISISMQGNLISRDSLKVGKWGLFSGIVALIIGLLSFAIATFPSFNKNSRNHEKIDEIKTKTNNFNESNSLLYEELKESNTITESRLDSIIKNTNSILKKID